MGWVVNGPVPRDLEQRLRATLHYVAIDRLQALGADLAARLPADALQRLRGQVLAGKPLAALAAMARHDEALKASVSAWLAQSGDEVVRNVLGKAIDRNRAALEAWYRDVAARVAALDGPAAAAAADQIVRLWAEEFVSLLRAEELARLMAHHGAASASALAAKLREAGVAGIADLQLKGGVLISASLGLEVRLAERVAAFPLEKIRALPDARLLVRENVEKLVRQGKDQVLKGVLQAGPAIGWEEAVAAAGAGKEPAAVFDRLFGALPADRRELVSESLAHLASASAFLREQPAEPGRRRGAMEAPAARLEGQDADSFKRLMSGPMGGAFPGLQAGIKVAEFVAGNLELGRLAGKINRASERIDRYVEEEMHLRRAIEESESRESVARVDVAISRLHRKHAATDMRYRRDAVEKLGESIDELRAKLTGYRLNHFFYVAEELRARYAALNRSLHLWTGGAGGSRNYVRDTLRNDPRQLRLAVDPYVRAFDIFSDPDASRQRENISQLAGYWSYLAQQLDNYCTNANSGCSRATPNMGKIGQTDVISVRNALPAEWERFELWKARRSGEPFTFALLVRPGLHSLPADQYRQAARVVHVMLSRARNGGTREAATGVTLSHPGFAFIPTRDGYRSEVLQPDEREFLDTVDDAGTVASYEQRWAQPGGLSLRAFEGYGLFTVWLIEVRPQESNYAAGDFLLRIIYQYRDQQRSPLTAASLNPRSIELLAAERGNAVAVRPSNLVMLGDREAIEKFVRGWTERKGSAAQAEWKHGLLVQDSTPREPAFDQGLVDAVARILNP
jgi:hypothetical protein